jgi:hypothetical protein
MLSIRFRRRAGSGRPRLAHCFRPVLEALEDRVVPYALSGSSWANPNVSVSYMPDGTLISSSYPSNLFAVYNAAYPQVTWQREVARALQSWADVSNLNFHFVPDDGSPQGTAGLAQGDPRFGDIRIGGYNMGSGILGIGWNPSSTTTGGDVELNTASALAIGSMPDLASVVMHEVGHGIGFLHSLVDPAVMEGGLWGVYPGPYADDIAGVQAMYGARKPDAYEGTTGNGTLATAAPLTLSSGGVTINADITSMGEVDYFKVTAPANADGSLTVTVDASTISLFDPKVSVFNSSGALLGTASASTYQGTATLHLTGLVAGQTYYLQAAGATTDVFGMGAYKLWAQFGPVPAPSLSLNNVARMNGTSGTTAFTFTAALSAASINPVTVQYATADGTATVADNDYTPVSGTLTFSPGQTQQTITVLVNGDAVAEPNETFSVNLSSPTNAVLGTSQGTGTIEDGYIGPDSFDPNNTMATAANLGKVNSISRTGLTLDTPTNVDYFRFVAASKGTFAVSATPAQGSGTLGLSVYNASGTQLATGQLANATVTLSVSLSSGATYYLKVWSPTSSLLVYNLSMSASAGGHHLVIGRANPDDPVAGDVFYRNAAADPDNPGHVPDTGRLSGSSPPPAGIAPLAAGPSVVVAPPARPSRDGAGIQRSLADVLLTLGQQGPPVPTARVPAVVTAAPATGPVSVVVAGRQPHLPPLWNGGSIAPAGNEDPQVVPAGREAPQAVPAGLAGTLSEPPGAPIDLEARARVGEGSRMRASDACFGSGSWMADPASPSGPLPAVAAEGPGPALDEATAAVTFAVLIGGFGGCFRAQAESRTPRRFLR